MDPLLQKMMEQREQAIRDRENAEQIIRTLDTLIHDYQGTLAKIGKARETRQADLFAAKMTKAERSKYVADMMETVEKLIAAAGKPLSRSALLDALEARGYVIEGGDKSKVLGTNLWRSKRFHNLKGAGYWPKSVPIPEEYADLEQRPSLET
jgi:reverse gyrase